MKKILKVISSGFLLITLVGCSSDKPEQMTDQNQNNNASSQNDSMTSDGVDSTILWDDVKLDYQGLEESIASQFEQGSTISKETVKNDVETISSGYDKISKGIDEENKDIAKEMYQAAHRLEISGKKMDETKDHEYTKLGENTKAYIKYLHGEKLENHEKTKTEIENVINLDSEKMNNMTDEFYSYYQG